MRVLVLHNQISPYRLPIFEKLNEKFEVTVLFCEPRSPDRLWETEVIKEFNFHWRVLRGKRIGRIILNNPIEIVRELKDSDVVIIAEIVENTPSTVLTIILSRILGKEIILWTERIESPWINLKFRGLKKILKETYERTIFFMSNIVAAYSKKAREHALKIGTSPGKLVEGIQVVPQEIYPEGEQKVSGIEKFKRRVLYLGYLRPEKGVAYLIDAFGKLKTDAILIIAGKGPILKELRKNAGEKVVFTGYVPEEAKAYLYKVSSIFVLPTLHDPWGLVINESLYYGTPVITTTAAAGSILIEEGKTGFIIQPGNERELQKTLGVILENPKLIRKMKYVTKKIGKKYSNAKLGTRHFLKAIQKLHE